MPDLNTCPSCRTECRDPWHYEADLEDEQFTDDHPGYAVAVRQLGHGIRAPRRA